MSESSFPAHQHAHVLIYAPDSQGNELQRFVDLLRGQSDAIQWERVADVHSARYRLASFPHGVLLFISNSGDQDEWSAWQTLHSTAPDVIGIFYISRPKAESVRSAYQLGIAEVLLATDQDEHLQYIINSALSRAEHTQRVQHLTKSTEWDEFDQTLQPVDQSVSMRQALHLLMKVAATPLPVLINGETGTGKSVLARYLHSQSNRHDRTFMTINCGALTPSLLESELFGHEKGAFTGANARRVGLLEVADGGTLFLDEINSAPMDLQVRLLQFIQEKRFLRVGGNQMITVDVRLIFASNKSLQELVESGQFREDLFYRINVFPIQIPPLRERVEDIPQIAAQALLRACSQLNKPVKACGPGVLEAVRRYHWPGNLRELDNVIQRALIVASGERVELSDLPSEIATASPTYQRFSLLKCKDHSFPWAENAPLEEVEHYWINHVLHSCRGNRTHAAKRLGIDPSTLWRKLKNV